MILFTILGGIVFVILSSIFNGYALAILWKWFVASTFNITSLQENTYLNMNQI